MSPEANTLGVEYIAHNDGIHEFILLKPTREAVDAIFDKMDELFQAATPEGIVRFLFDYRQSGIPPMRYSYGRAQEFYRRQKNQVKTRAAYLYDGGALLALAQSFQNLLSARTVGRFFPVEQRDKAIEWLLGQG